MTEEQKQFKDAFHNDVVLAYKEYERKKKSFEAYFNEQFIMASEKRKAIDDDGSRYLYEWNYKKKIIYVLRTFGDMNKNEIKAKIVELENSEKVTYEKLRNTIPAELKNLMDTEDIQQILRDDGKKNLRKYRIVNK